MPQFTNLDAIKKRRDEQAAKRAKKEKKEEKKRERELREEASRTELMGEELTSSSAEPRKNLDEETPDENVGRKGKGRKDRKGKKHARKHKTVQEQFEDLEDLTEPVRKEDKGGETKETKKNKKKEKKSKKGETDHEQPGMVGMQITRQRTSTHLLAEQEEEQKDSSKKNKKKEKKKQIGAVKLAEDEVKGDAQIKLSDEQCNKLMELGELIGQVKVAANQQSGKIDEHEDVLEQVEDAVFNLQKVCSTCQFIWRIDEFRDRFQTATDGTRTTVYSPSFRSHPYGYQIALSLCPNGDGRGKGQFMSIFFCLLKGEYDSLLEWPFASRITFTLLDQAEASEVSDITAEFVPHPAKENLPFLGRPTKVRNPSLGLPRFVAHTDLWAGQYVKDDSIFIRVEVDLVDVALL